MRPLLTWMTMILGGLAGLVVIAAAAFFGLSQLTIDKVHRRDAKVTHVVSTPELVARGRHLSITRGCSDCHDANLQGQLWWEEKWVGRQFTANLTRRAQTYSDADFDRAIRGGIDNRGHALWDMPSAMYANLSDEDTAAVIAYIRSLPVGGKDHPKKHFGLGWRWEIIRDAEPYSSARYVDERKVPVDAGPDTAAGRYIAMTACSECHGGELAGQTSPEGKRTPDLIVAASYSDVEFTTLMRSGVPASGRKLVLMDEMARGRFAHFTDEEIAQLHTYLKARAATAKPD